MNISLIISTYNSPKKLNLVLNEIYNGTVLPLDIVISDDGSASETKLLINQWKDKLPIYHAWQEDKGFRKNRILNLSLSKTLGDYIIFIDGDCVPHRKFIHDHKKFSEQGYFIQGRRAFIKERFVRNVLNKHKSIFFYILTLKMTGVLKAIWLPKPIIKINQGQRGLIGCNFSAWKSDLVRINGFDMSYEGWGVGEDSDICTRLYNDGLFRKLIYGRAIVYHLDHPEEDKSHHEKSLKKLEYVKEKRIVRCKHGLDECIAEFKNQNQL